MRFFIFVALLLAWPMAAQELTETEQALLQEKSLWAIVNENSPGLESYFSDEEKRQQSERQALIAERSAFEQERQAWESEKQRQEQEKLALARLQKQVVSDRKQIDADSKSIDARERRMAVLEGALRWAPVAGLVVFGAGFLTHVAMVR